MDEFKYPNISLYKIPRETLNEMLAEDDLDAFERYIRQVEQNIFVDPFTADKIERHLQLYAASEKIDELSESMNEAFRNSPFRDTAIAFFNNIGMPHVAVEIETGQPSRSEGLSLAEKKNYYRVSVPGTASSELVPRIR